MFSAWNFASINDVNNLEFSINSALTLLHSHKKRKDSLETRAEPAVFSL